MPGGECCICGKHGFIEWHHVIFRSQSIPMKSINCNMVQLCVDCHRGTLGVHNNKKNDLKLKIKLQMKLFKMFADKDYFTLQEIKEILGTTEVNAMLIVKKLSLFTEGYEQEQIIRRLLGGRTY